MRRLFIFPTLALFALASCDRGEVQDAPAEIDEALENRELAGNDITAIDAAHAADAGMVDDLDPDAEVDNLEYQTEVVPPREIEEPEERPTRPTRPANDDDESEDEPASPPPQQPQDELAPRPEPQPPTN